MIIAMEELQNYDFSLSGIRVFHQKPAFRQQRHPSRKCNGFVYLLAGSCRFSTQNGNIDMTPGAVCYLPYGSNHVFDILEEGTEFYRIDFHLTVSGKVVRFSDGPLLLCPKASAECDETMREMAEKCEFVQDFVRKTELLCGVFRMLASDGIKEQRRTAPAVEYLQAHLTEKISCGELARMCNLGTAQFYNLFQAEHGTTPLAYRDHLLLQRAKVLLYDGSFFVGEVADMLGFESSAYFSRFFKKHQGVSPSKYAEQKKVGT